MTQAHWPRMRSRVETVGVLKGLVGVAKVEAVTARQESLEALHGVEIIFAQREEETDALVGLGPSYTLIDDAIAVQVTQYAGRRVLETLGASLEPRPELRGRAAN